ncbi:MAG TPA: group 1 truncated hemoglobin [Acidimicrobiales bacterium]|jgi:hemoglobin|nr:group 1 truncated hemoglobin [Acidimicrobiales bacterium]
MSIYSEIGGREAVELAVTDFYARVLADPSLAPYFEGVDMDHLMRHQRAFVGMALGGPVAYQGQDMKTAHQGLDITSEAFDTVVSHLAATLTSLGVPDVTIGQIAGALLPLKDDIVTADQAPPAAAFGGRRY